MNIFVHGACATPTPLLEAMVARPDLENIRLYHLHLNGPLPFAAPPSTGEQGRFHSVSFFTSPGLRDAVNDGRADLIPVLLSDVPGLFLSGRIRLDAALLQLSEPNRHGIATLGTSVDAARAAVDTAPVLIAEVNARMPRTHGYTGVPLRRLAAWTRTDRPLHEHAPDPPGPVSDRIGELVAGLVDDGACLQMGIGAIPDAVLARLGNKHDLGIHTEMFSDGVIDLMDAGVITNRRKAVLPGRTIASFLNGSRRLFDFVDDNPLVELHGCDRTNDTSIIRRNDNVVAINSALQVDLTGQVCADSLGHRIYSGIGGQLDFIHGAALSRNGRPIIALPSTAAGGAVSRIVHELAPGAGVVTTRGHVHWVVTEFGAVNLRGMTLRERAEALISIAHPDFRPELRRHAAALRHFTFA
jgi:acyl-CoA hydrolase